MLTILDVGFGSVENLKQADAEERKCALFFIALRVFRDNLRPQSKSKCLLIQQKGELITGQYSRLHFDLWQNGSTSPGTACPCYSTV